MPPDAIHAAACGFLVERRGPIEVLSLDRGDSLNSLTATMTRALRLYFEGLCQRIEVRVVILRANGRAFCAGLDLNDLAGKSEETQVIRTRRTQRAVAGIIRAMRACPQPIIGLGHGAACGGGFSLLLACDVRYGAPNLRMNAAYFRIGLGSCDIGASYLLPRLVGASVASEMLLTGRSLEAERALKISLLSGIVPETALLDTGLALAAEMLATGPTALALSKDVPTLNLDAPSRGAALPIEDRQQVQLAGQRDHREAVGAFLGKRIPVYSDL